MELDRKVLLFLFTSGLEYFLMTTHTNFRIRYRASFLSAVLQGCVKEV